VIAYLWWRRAARLGWFARLVELIYGLVNPALYLLFIQRGFELRRYAPLTAAAWALLAIVWGSRLWGGFERLRRADTGRLAVRAVLVLALLCLGAFLLKDVSGLVAGWPANGWQAAFSWVSIPLAINLGALYAIPALAALRHLRTTASAERWSERQEFFLLSPRVTAWSAAALAVLTAAVWIVRPSTAEVERRIVAHRGEILDAARRTGLDPRLIAAVVYVVQSDQTPFADAVERTAMGAWLADATNDFGFEVPFDLSVGIAQIKPLTAHAALVIYTAAAAPPPADDPLFAPAEEGSPKHLPFLGSPPLGARWKLSASAVAALVPLQSGVPPKPDLVEALFDDRQNIAMCALILALYAVQWESADPAWSVRERPEILATLYQRGFESSWPKANPRPDRFGERVRQVFDSPWMRAQFSPRPAAP